MPYSARPSRSQLLASWKAQQEQARIEAQAMRHGWLADFEDRRAQWGAEQERTRRGDGERRGPARGDKQRGGDRDSAGRDDDDDVRSEHTSRTSRTVRTVTTETRAVRPAPAAPVLRARPPPREKRPVDGATVADSVQVRRDQIARERAREYYTIIVEEE